MSRGPPGGKRLQKRCVVSSKVFVLVGTRFGVLGAARKSQTVALLFVFRCISQCSQPGGVLLPAVADRNAPACCERAPWPRSRARRARSSGSSNTWPRLALNAPTVGLEPTWMTPSEAPKALQASECSELLDPMRASCWISAQHWPGKFVQVAAVVLVAGVVLARRVFACTSRGSLGCV